MTEQKTGHSGISRRGFGTAVGTGVAATLATGWASNASSARAGERPFEADTAAAATGKPNILVILGDDLGWGDLSSYGAPTIRTPNLDRIAAAGVRFTDAYAASSVCSPTRFALYTGRYPGRLHGGLQEPIPAPSRLDGIPLNHPTLATLLKGVGYDTAMIGKWHCGFLPWFSPTRLGWDSFYGNFSGGIDYFSKYAHFGVYDLYENEVEAHDLRYYTDILTEKAVEYVGGTHTKPWLLNLNFTTPHWPWEGRSDRAVSNELTARLKAGDTSSLFHNDGGTLNVYWEMVENLDAAVGQIVTRLKQTGQWDNTLIFFASDNGGERFSFTWPFSGGKAQVLEGGIRVPLVVSWPARLRPNQVSSLPVNTPDWTATFLEIAGAKPDPRYPLDGRSLGGYLLRGQQLPTRDLFWRMKGQRALRRGNLKYVRLVDGVDKLYDLGADQHEQSNLATKKASHLASLRTAWAKVNATLLPYPS